MSRTYRRGKPSKDLNLYINRDVIRHENQVIPWSWSSHQGLQVWKDDWEDQTTYKEYVEERIQVYHRDKVHYTTKYLPKWFRRDLRHQEKLYHRMKIQRGIATGDLDIVLDTHKKGVDWFYW